MPFGSGTRANAPHFPQIFAPSPDDDRDEAARARRGSWWGSRGWAACLCPSVCGAWYDDGGGGNVVVGVLCERRCRRTVRQQAGDDADTQLGRRGRDHADAQSGSRRGRARSTDLPASDCDLCPLDRGFDRPVRAAPPPLPLFGSLTGDPLSHPRSVTRVGKWASTPSLLISCPLRDIDRGRF
ncbi:hypothetical protein EDB84DRAFT_1446981 [Lactarius hengduanensis]|nr:hypothetical protein EDB84DRAFT_1446981 [Lactarius hengduanensis]